MNQNTAGNSTLTIAPGRVPDGLLMIWTTSEFGCWKRILSQHALHHGLLAPGLSLVLKSRRLGMFGRLALKLIPQRIRVIRIVRIVRRDLGELRFVHGFDGNELLAWNHSL